MASTRALQERSLFQSQQYATSVYRSELAMRLQGLGYEIERGKHGQPEIKGYTQEYLDASSPRREQIKEHLQEIGRDGAGAAQVAAHRTRDSKENASRRKRSCSGTVNWLRSSAIKQIVSSRKRTNRHSTMRSSLRRRRSSR